MSEQLSAPYLLQFTYTRTTGPVIGRFLTGLRDGRIEGVKAKDGRVLVPPVEYDERGDATTEFVEVGTSGTVTSWTWVATPRALHPLQRPFAFALIKLDGADTALTHVVDAGSESAMKTGMRVRVRWAEERTGMITDIACFEPEAP
jgi:uncharacterized OB-fold protein